MTFNDILRPKTQDQPVVTRVEGARTTRRPTPPRREVEDEIQYATASATDEPHWPRVFPGI